MQSWGINSAIKLLTYSSELKDGQVLYASSNCHPEATSKNEDTDKKVPKEKDSEYIPSYDSHNIKGKKKSEKSYREAALKHHPDKLATLLLAEETEEAKQAKKDEIESHFKLIQEAYEVLMDPTKRRIFDSTDEFDDKVPTDCAPQDFFKLERVSLKKRSMISSKQNPVRKRGGWRERMQEKTQKARKEEYARIRTLVDNAYKKDTRIQKRKDDEKAKKMQKKEAKVMAKKQQEEAAAAAIEEEKEAKRRRSKTCGQRLLSCTRGPRKKRRSFCGKERSRLRTLSAPVLSQRLLGVSDEHVEDLYTATHQKKEKPWSKEEIDMLRKGTTKFPKGTSQRWEVISEYIGTGRSETCCFNHFSSLYTRGTRRTYYTDQPHEDNNSPKTVTAEQNGKREENSNGNSEPDAAAGSDPDGWSAVQERALVQALKTFPKETNQRWERVATAVPGKTMNQCKKKFAELKDIIRIKKPTA
ncbi:SANT/Myb domain [Arabidopsis thaliana x Arabidopsis arenosa]|uniref:SANT/Myb domain n=1 Tax=Arabidopsis thaliana x Arabidopsis arenosa TaxID=1240361 RepID=A0A8T1XBM6_9BRAS|nr:SANT/Myb domain [Arabidopsis thaliana x Arabidopsis arenosa]